MSDEPRQIEAQTTAINAAIRQAAGTRKRPEAQPAPGINGKINDLIRKESK